VRYISHGLTAQGLPFLAMDWLEGEDLSERLWRASLEVQECLTLVRRACEGLAVAHARGVVHRDVKPSNLFLVDGDPASIKVIDFGVARIAEGAGAFTRPGTTLGTAGYMAPEQAAGATDVDARADVYGLGCVLFECLTGRPPLVGRPAALLAKVLREEPPVASSLQPELNEEADLLLARLLAKDREQRPRDARELLGILDSIGTLVRGR
jgi:eukaryotic-like serine/threonine-protein kinase